MNFLRVLIWGGLFWAMAVVAPGQAAEPTKAADSTKIVSLEGITEYRLANGLQVLIYPDDSKPTVTVNLTVFVGSRHEGYGETGMAHLLEHMLFKGTPTHPLIPKVLQERGARFNGTTWVDRTNYYETLPANDDNLEFALRLEADRLVNSNVRQEDLLSEMTVVRNEFERGENSPAMLLYQRMLAVAYEWHNYGKVTIGNRTDIERVPIQRLKEFYVRYYQPDNAMVVVAGQCDEAKTLALVEKYFGRVEKPARKLPATYTEEPPQDGERSVVLRRVGDVGLVGAVYHVPAGPHPDIAPLELLSHVLSDAPGGRLYKAMVESHKATSVAADVTSWHDPGVFEVAAEVRRGDSLDEARDAMLDVTENFATQDLSDRDVDRARQKILKARELRAADTSTLAVELSNWAAQGDWRLYFLYRDRVEAVKAPDLKDVAARYLVRNNRTGGMFVPSDKSDRISIPATPNIAKLLANFKARETMVAGEAFDVAPLSIEKRTERATLTGGMKAAFLPKKTRGQTVHLRFIVRYGNEESLKGYRAAADMLPTLMMRGTKKLSRQEIQDQLDKNRATLTPHGDLGAVAFTVETLHDQLPAVLDIVRQVLREPIFPDDEYQILQRQSLTDLEEQLTDPQSLAIIRLRRKLNPFDKEDVRYTPTVQEDIEETTALTLAQVKKLYQQFLSNQAGEVTVVGDFEREPTFKLLKTALADWKVSEPYARVPKIVFQDITGGRAQIETPDKANAVYTAGEVFALSDADPDYAPLVLGNFIFGGGALSSRLGDRVRQKEGLSYGIGSFIAAEALDKRASLTMFAIYNPENGDKVEAAIQEELARFLKAGITDEELERAKRGYLQQQQVSRTSDSSLASTLADTLFDGRTMQYYADLEKQIQAQTPATVLAAWRKNISLERLVVVAAGDFAGAKKSADKSATEEKAVEK